VKGVIVIMLYNYKIYNN